ncbi:UNVERIFIED_CONTAM: hypothetical protein GTU68_023171 [Idotea baltica]|nr:hypothetical protein [Idotea baltica]
MNFFQSLKSSWRTNNSLVCVGLDPDLNRIPACVPRGGTAMFNFNKKVIDATADLVCAFKPQIAHYSAYGAEDQLIKTISYIHENYPSIPVILDAKRGDIGSTATKYAQEAFERYEVDAVTVNPYLGFDSVEPFVKYKNKGIIVLCRTSNPSAPDFQDCAVDGKKLYIRVAEKVINEWNANGNCLMVVGATYPNELSEIREIARDMPLLVPGAGAQGGDIKQAILNGKSSDKTGLIVSSSRKILYASAGEDFAEAARQETSNLRNEINLYR